MFVAFQFFKSYFSNSGDSYKYLPFWLWALGWLVLSWGFCNHIIFVVWLIARPLVVFQIHPKVTNHLTLAAWRATCQSCLTRCSNFLLNRRTGAVCFCSPNSVLPRQACELISQEINEWELNALVCCAGGDEEGGELLAGMERVERGACVPLDAS